MGESMAQDAIEMGLDTDGLLWEDSVYSYKDSLINKIYLEENGSNLSFKESHEINHYTKIFLENGFKEHYEVNRYISKMNLWDEFQNIRSLNDHGENKNIPGILPKFYAIVCKKLEITGAGGTPLDQAKHY